MNEDKSTSWEPVQRWYKNVVGKEGHYYHQKIVLPNTLKLLNLRPSDSILDLACGTGVLAGQLPKGTYYEGVDISPSFIQSAKKMYPEHRFYLSDICKPLPVKKKDFTHVTVLLAIQNIESPKHAFDSAYQCLDPKGHLLLVLNHPCFRIPRQSSWGHDPDKNLQFRRIDCYSSALKIPIASEPSKGSRSNVTYSFHHPLSSYIQWLSESGFLIENIEEWHSDKESTGKYAKMENRSRLEIPLFMALLCVKK